MWRVFGILVYACMLNAEPVNQNLTWDGLFRLAKSETKPIIRMFLPYVLRSVSSANIRAECQSSLLNFFLSLQKFKSWAVLMVDASGKLPGGVLDGTVMDFGSFDECLKIRVNDSSDSNKEAFRGRYCMVGYHSPLITPMYLKTPSGQSYVEAYGYPPEWAADIIIRAGGYLKRVALWFGTCVPSTCTKDDVQKLASVVSKPLGFNVSVATCQVDEPFVWPTYSVVAVCVLGCLGALCLLGSFLDILNRCTAKYPKEVPQNSLLRALKAFSLYSNTEKLFGDSGGKSGALGCFHGIRFLSATWIILGHTYFYTDTWKYLKYRHLLGVEEEFDGYLPLAVIENFTIPVGSFFFMSGFLLMFTTWKKLEKSEGHVNLLMFFVHKYWRMTPALGLTLILFMVLPLIDSGPIWNSTLDPPLQACNDLWWANMLYINNWWNTDQYCLIHTWYLASLMQFHLVGIILLLLTFRWRVVGILLGAVILIGCFIVTTLLTVWHDFPMPAPGMVKDMDVIDDYNSRLYVKPFTFMGTYVTGMVVAYFVLKYKDQKIKPVWQVVGWTLATLSALSAVYGLYGPGDDIGVRALYISGHRYAWALGIGWMTYACITGMGGIVNRILSWKAMIPLGNLSYLAYLIHPLVIIYRNASLRERVYYGHTELVFSFLATTVVSLFLAYVGYIAVEMPFSTLEGIIFKSSSSVNLSKKPSVVKEEVPPPILSIKTVSP
ncbi:nose resistant to fluoxetine protein 6-like isoform X2 [Stegodyphus dumicola]|uniref:nose resistant to fluoxetine protein 6-like isoform X2 n=1 Tax=Stegodyphus dumicola TaxID=202533 RepID=UPI0015A7D72D|nr:nose resistant to fluoxetine protein 6-like isoform X2 [Stegodyphus dumicola]